MNYFACTTLQGNAKRLGRTMTRTPRTNYRNQIYRVLATGIFCSSSIAYGESALDLFQLPIEDLLKVKVEVSNRNPTSVIDTPSSVSVYSRSEIQRMGIRSLDDLLNFVPGFVMSRSDSDGRSHTPTVRGRRSDSVGREILVLMDGIRLNDPVSGGVFSQERDLSLLNVKQVEVIRGPGSTLYGANAFSAVINVVTDTEDRFAEVRYGSFDALGGAVMLSEHSGNSGFSVTASHYKDNGEHYDAFYDFFGVLEDTQDPQRLSDIYLKAYHENTTLVVRRNERSSADFISGGGQANGRQRHRVENRSMRLAHQVTLNELQTTWFAEHTKSDSDALLGLFPENPSPPLAGNPFYWSDGSTVEMIGGNIRTVEQKRIGVDSVWRGFDGHVVNLGVLYRLEAVSLNPFQSNIDPVILESTNNLVPTPADDFIQTGFYIAGDRYDLLEASDRESAGLYVQDTWLLQESVTLTSGVRYDKYQDFGDNLSFRVGAVHAWDENTSFKLLYGDAFRAPSFIETRAGIATGGISNPDLEPEQVKTYELSWLENHNQFSFVSTFFQNNYENIVEPVLVSDVVPGFTAFQPQNLSSKETNGLEIELNGELTQDMRLRAGWSHLFKKISGQPVGDNSAFLVWNYQVDQTNLNINAYYHDDIPARPNDDSYLSSYWLSNLAINHRLNPYFTLGFEVKNLFDESYSTWSSQAGLEDGLPGRGRAFFASVKLSGF